MQQLCDIVCRHETEDITAINSNVFYNYFVYSSMFEMFDERKLFPYLLFKFLMASLFIFRSEEKLMNSNECPTFSTDPNDEKRT